MVPSASSLQKTIGVTRTECLASTGLTDVAWSKRKGLTSILRIGEINAQKGRFFCLCYLNLRSKKNAVVSFIIFGKNYYFCRIIYY